MYVRSLPSAYYTLSRCHDYHFKIYAAMFLGQYRPAIEAAEEMIRAIPEELLRWNSPAAQWLEGFIPMKVHVLIRFGKWREVVALPVPSSRELYPATIALIHYGKGVAQAALGQIQEAEIERKHFAAAVARVPESRMFFNNKYTDILAVAAAMLDGEIEYRRGDYERAFSYLRTAVQLDDNLSYDEPWGWMQPVRHALGALLLEQNRVEEAARIYRADLGWDASVSRSAWHPNNVWSLHEYVECLRRLGSEEEAAFVQTLLDPVLARADAEITASCFCRTGNKCCGGSADVI